MAVKRTSKTLLHLHSIYDDDVDDAVSSEVMMMIISNVGVEEESGEDEAAENAQRQQIKAVISKEWN